MKRILLGAVSEELLGTLEIILKHWGYRTLVTSRDKEFCELFENSPPDLVLIGRKMLEGAASELQALLQEQLIRTDLPLFVLGTGPAIPIPRPYIEIDVPVDIFALFELVQRYIEKHPRRNLRLEVSIPGMVCRDQGSELAEVLSISSRGLFIKTSFRLEPKDHFQVLFPLMGMNQELELPGRVVYRMDPRPENNYRQGVGLEFTELTEETRRRLEEFLEQRLFRDLGETKRSAELDFNMLRSRHSGSTWSYSP